MQVALIQITDLHAKQGSNFTSKISPICALLENRDIEKVILCFSGDLTQSGQKREFDSVEYFIRQLKGALAKKNINQIEVVSVPGNHDLAYEPGFVRPRENVGDLTDKIYYKDLEKDMARLEAYYSFQKEVCPALISVTPSLYKATIPCGSVDLTFYCINDVIDSTFYGAGQVAKDGSAGKIHIPHDVFNEMKKEGKSIMVSIFHFPPAFFDEQAEKRFEGAVSVFHFALFGHIHAETDSQWNFDNSHCQVSTAAAFNNPDSSSGLAIILLDTEKLISQRASYSFDVNLGKYILSSEPINERLFNVSEGNGLTIQDDFKESEIGKDALQLFEGSKLTDYYQFPELSIKEYSTKVKTDESRVRNFEDFNQKINGYSFVTIFGTASSGKTAFLKNLFIQFQNSFLPLFFRANQFLGKTSATIKKVIYSSIKQQYCGDSDQLFDQEPKKYRIALIDDFDQLKGQQTDIFNALKPFFGIVVVTKFKDPFDVLSNVADDISDNVSDETSISFQILPFYYKKREELYEKVYLALSASEGKERDRKETDDFCKSLNIVFDKCIGPSSCQPDILVLSCQAFYKSEKAVSISSNIYNTVFETHIVSLLLNVTDGESENVELYIALLSKIAFFISKRERYEATMPEINDIIEKYKQDFLLPEICPSSFLDLMIKAKIMSFKNGFYFFTSKDFLSFFSAKEYSSLLKNDIAENRKELLYLLNNIFVGVNSSILLFVAFNTTPNIIDIILDSAEKELKDFAEEDFSHFPVFKEIQKQIDTMKLLDIEDHKRISDSHNSVEQANDERGKREYSKNVTDSVKSSPDVVENQLQKLMAYLSLLTAIIPDFKTRLLADRQVRCVSLIYSISNKVLTLAYDMDDERIAVLIAFLRERLADKMGNTCVNDAVIKDWVVDSIRANVLGVFDYAASRSVTSLTYGIMTDSKFKTPDPYCIERLMMVSFGKKDSLFRSEACALYDKYKDNPLLRDCIRLIVRRWIFDSSSITFHGDDAVFVDTFFPGESSRMLAIQKKNSFEKK